VISLNTTNDFKVQEYTVCAGRNCNNLARNFLTIVLIKQSGWFCEKCSQGLKEAGLVESEIDVHIKDKKGGSKFD
jgi:hypothetical protein